MERVGSAGEGATAKSDAGSYSISSCLLSGCSSAITGLSIHKRVQNEAPVATAVVSLSLVVFGGIGEVLVDLLWRRLVPGCCRIN